MATFKKTEDIWCFNIAREQAKQIWLDVHRQNLFGKDYPLIKQINRASGSVMDNIAEGFGRGGNREFLNFLSIARGSNEEVKSQILRAFDREHYDQKTYEARLQSNIRLSIGLSKLMKHLRDSNIKGNKWENGDSPTANEERAIYVTANEEELLNEPFEFDIEKIIYQSLREIHFPDHFFSLGSTEIQR